MGIYSEHIIRRIILSISLITILYSLVSCFHSSDDSVVILDDDINGIWIDDNRGIGIISDYGRNFNIVSLHTSQENSQYRGDIHSRSGVIHDSFISSYRSDGSLGYVYYLDNGTAVPKENINVVYEDRFMNTIVLDMTYDSLLTERPSSLDLISGIWSYTNPYYTVTLTIDTQGHLFGSDTDGCTFSGSLSIPHVSINIYEVKFSKSGCDSPPSMSEGKGQAILIDSTNLNDTLIMAITRTVSTSASMVFRLTRQ